MMDDDVIYINKNEEEEDRARLGTVARLGASDSRSLLLIRGENSAISLPCHAYNCKRAGWMDGEVYGQMGGVAGSSKLDAAWAHASNVKGECSFVASARNQTKPLPERDTRDRVMVVGADLRADARIQKMFDANQVYYQRFIF